MVIPKEARDRYFDALEAANQGDLTPFNDFVAERYERSLDHVLGQAAGQNSPADEQS